MTQEAIQEEVMPVVQRVNTLQVTDEPSEKQASVILVTIKSLLKKVEEEFGPAVKAAHKAHKEALAVKKKYEDPLKKAETTVKRLIGKYRAELERKRIEEQRRLEAEARRKAEEERRKEAEALKAAGEKAAAAVKAHTPVKVEPVPTVQQKPQQKGVNTRTIWKAEVTDIKQLCLAVANGTVSESYIEANMKALNNAARQAKGRLAIPGVKAVSEVSVASRSTLGIEVTEF